jgi:UDP-N-acetylglucosamine pyrophosphorylase
MQEKIDFLNSTPGVLEYLEENPELKKACQDQDLEGQVVIKSIIAIGQAGHVFEAGVTPALMHDLGQVERFYDTIGGIIGYHEAVLKLLSEKEGKEATYSVPKGFDTTKETKMTYEGILSLDKIGFIFAVGGAGERLGIKGKAVAELPFLGRSLLEGLVRDVEGLEKLFNKPLSIPIALMTSTLTHERIVALLEDNDWFGRGKDAFFIFTQPQVPVITEEGEWVMAEPGLLQLKPGGHGAIWKLASDSGALGWFLEQGKKKVCVRQINNPIAGVDHGLLSFLGVGFSQDKDFGFSSCYRQIGTAEGVDVLVEEKDHLTHIGSIEYTDFEKHGIADVPKEKGSPYSAYPTNTNILFADIAGIIDAVKIHPIPGMLLNMKSEVTSIHGHKVKAGRLESSMQNLSEAFKDSFGHKVTKDEQLKLKTYLTFNDRIKTISVTKKLEGGIETPQSAYSDVQKNAEDLLKNNCNFKVEGPIHFTYSPSLGPLYSIIAKKLQGGVIEEGSYLDLETSEVDVKGLHLKGSLIIAGEGRCLLHDVKVENAGADLNDKENLWKGEIPQREAFQILLEEGAEFEARGIIFKGPFKVEVPKNHRTVAKVINGNIHFETEKLFSPSWKWEYEFGDGVILKKVFNA